MVLEKDKMFSLLCIWYLFRIIKSVYLSLFYPKTVPFYPIMVPFYPKTVPFYPKAVPFYPIMVPALSQDRTFLS